MLTHVYILGNKVLFVIHEIFISSILYGIIYYIIAVDYTMDECFKNLHAQFVKLDREEKAAQPAWQGEKYVRPLFPQTGSMSVSVHKQLKLHAAVKFTLNGSKLLKRKNTCLFSLFASICIYLIINITSICPRFCFINFKSETTCALSTVNFFY